MSSEKTRGSTSSSVSFWRGKGGEGKEEREGVFCE